MQKDDAIDAWLLTCIQDHFQDTSLISTQKLNSIKCLQTNSDFYLMIIREFLQMENAADLMTNGSKDKKHQNVIMNRYRLCSDLSRELERRGYAGPIGFHQFLHPSLADIRKLLIWLLEYGSTSKGAGSPVVRSKGREKYHGMEDSMKCDASEREQLQQALMRAFRLRTDTTESLRLLLQATEIEALPEQEIMAALMKMRRQIQLSHFSKSREMDQQQGSAEISANQETVDHGIQADLSVDESDLDEKLHLERQLDEMDTQIQTLQGTIHEKEAVFEEAKRKHGQAKEKLSRLQECIRIMEAEAELDHEIEGFQNRLKTLETDWDEYSRPFINELNGLERKLLDKTRAYESQVEERDNFQLKNQQLADKIKRLELQLKELQKNPPVIPDDQPTRREYLDRLNALAQQVSGERQLYQKVSGEITELEDQISEKERIIHRQYASAESFLKPPPETQKTQSSQQRRFQQHVYSHFVKLHSVFLKIYEQQRELDTTLVRKRQQERLISRLTVDESVESRWKSLKHDYEALFE